MNSERIFYCNYTECEYSSISFNRVLNRAWETHSISPGFECKCDISSCSYKEVPILIYKVLGGTLKVIIVGFMKILSGAMREKIIIVK